MLSTLNKRNIIIFGLNFLSAAFILSFLTLLFFLNKNLPQTFTELLVTPNILIPSATILFSLFSVSYIRKLFMNTVRMEIFFFLIFLLTLTFDMTKSVIFLFEKLDKPEFYLLMLTKTAYFGKILGILSLFCFSLTAIENNYRKYTILFSTIITISLFIALFLPFSQEKGKNMLFIPGYKIFFNSIILIWIITVLILFFNYLQNNNKEHLYFAGSIILIFIGSSVLFYTVSFVYAFIGMSLLIAGTAVISCQMRKLYMWY